MQRKKMKIISSHTMRRHLVKERESGYPTAFLLTHISLFAISLCANETNFISKHQAAGGTITALSYHIAVLLLRYCKLLSGRLQFPCCLTCGYKVNAFTNFTALVLSPIFESFYEKSLASLGVILSMAVLVVFLIIIIQPRNNLGILGFLVGVAGSITHGLYKLGFRTFLVVAFCFVLVSLNCWLDKNWLEVDVQQQQQGEEDRNQNQNQNQTILPFSNSRIIRSQESKRIPKSILKFLLVTEAVIVLVFLVYWDQYLLRVRIRCTDSCSLTSLLGLAACLSILCFWFIRVIVRFRKLHREVTEEKVFEMPNHNILDIIVNDESIESIEEDKGEIEEIIPKKLGPYVSGLTTDTLKQRHNKPKERMESSIMPAPSTSFLEACFLCKRQITPNRDIYMYKGDTAFCSLYCRYRHACQDDECIDPEITKIRTGGNIVSATEVLHQSSPVNSNSKSVYVNWKSKRKANNTRRRKKKPVIQSEFIEQQWHNVFSDKMKYCLM